MEKHGIALPGIENAREPGGWPAGGRPVKRGRLIRAGSLSQAAPETLESLRVQYRVRTVIDLRMSAEQRRIPDPVIPGAEYLHLPVVELEDILSAAGPSQAEQYSGLITDRTALFETAYESGMLNDRIYLQFLMTGRAKQAWRTFFEKLLAPDDGGAVLWHCTDGKDRTGCAAMLTLFALGADRETVMRDYLLTNVSNARKLEAVRQKIAPLGWPEEKENALLFFSGGVSAVYMDHAIDALNDRYGSVKGYLKQELGIGEEEQAALQEKFLQQG